MSPPRSADPRPPSSRRRAWAVALVLLSLAAAYFIARGPARADLAGSADFALIHASTTAWARGDNPYDAQTVAAIWADKGGAGEGGGVEYMLERGDKDLLYPPSAFLILSPLALLGAKAGLAVWVCLSIAGALLAAAVAARLAGFRTREPGFWLVIAAMLALAPGHTNFNVGQSAHVVLGIIALAYGARLWKPDRAGDVLCGVLLGAAAALKPQVGLPFLAFELLFARWATLVAGGTTGALLLLLGGARLWLADIDWIEAWRSNIAAFKQDGAGNPAPSNPWRYQMLSLHYPLHAFIPSARAVNTIVFLVCAALAAWFWTLRARAGEATLWRCGSPSHATAHTPRGPHLLDISMAAVLGLLFFYHRFYDAVVLIFPTALGIALLLRHDRRGGLALLAASAVFFVPGAAALFAVRDRLPEWLTDSLFFDGLIMPHQPWTILLLAVALTWLAARRLQPSPDAARP